jgi:hypothetical protein
LNGLSSPGLAECVRVQRTVAQRAGLTRVANVDLLAVEERKARDEKGRIPRLASQVVEGQVLGRQLAAALERTLKIEHPGRRQEPRGSPKERFGR